MTQRAENARRFGVFPTRFSTSRSPDATVVLALPRRSGGIAALSVLFGAGAGISLTATVACATAALGLWQGKRWGHRLAFVLIALNLTGDLANVALGSEPKAISRCPPLSSGRN